ncbi:hypothetical protein PFZ49_06970 [Microbacterium lacticum]|uniref:hypothetical protein n=1 Tax=Microbacterium lacticum TaxID=33885 RepID=UPI003A89C8C6
MERHERLHALNEDIAAFEKECLVRSLVGRFGPEHDAKLRGYYDERRRLYDEKGTDDE